MDIKVRIFGGLTRFTEGKAEATLKLSNGLRAWDLVDKFGIPPEEVWFVAVNGVRAAREHVLSAGDCVDIFAPVGGG